MLRKRFWLSGILTISAFLISCGSSGTPASTPPQDPTLAYIKAQAKPIESIDPGQTNFSDLTFLPPLLEGRKIVELGESGHGVAQFGQAKVRLIEYLHEQLGYNVIAFEASMLSTFRSNEIAASLTPTEFMEDSIFGVWNTTDVVKLFSYIQSTQNAAHPLILAGFDIQFTSDYEINYRPGAFYDLVSKVDPVYAQQVQNMDQAFIQNYAFLQNPLTSTDVANLTAEYQTLTAFIDAHMTQIAAAYPDRPLFPLVMRQMAWGMNAYVTTLYDVQLNQYVPASDARDAAMATNLEIVADQMYPDEKIMVWAHNAHIAHDAAVVTQWGWKNMGNWIFNKYGSSVYTLGLFMYQGSAAEDGGTVYSIPPAPALSLEGQLYTSGYSTVFLDFSQATPQSGNEWLFEPYPARDWGVDPMTIIPKDQFDGVLMVDTVNPPTYVPYPQSSVRAQSGAATDKSGRMEPDLGLR
jgi:erythromycin esterase